MTSSFHPTFFSTESYQDFVLLTLNKSMLTEEDNVEQLGHELNGVVDHFHTKQMVISLSHVEYVTSSIIGKLIALHRKLGRMDGKLVLIDINRPVHNVLAASNLNHYFTIAENIENATSLLSE